MFFCCHICSCPIAVGSYQCIRRHLSDHKRYGELKLPFEYQKESDCRASASTIFNFVRHLKNTHSLNFPDVLTDQVATAAIDEDADMEIDYIIDDDKRKRSTMYYDG